jgi:DNA-binding NtrC family response regulator
VERALLIAGGDALSAADLRLEAPRTNGAGAGALERMTLEDAERVLIRNALDRCQGNVNQAAELLGLSRSALYRRMEKYGF